MPNSSIWPIDRTLSHFALRVKVDRWAMVMNGVPHISQSSSIIGASPSHFLCHIQDTRWRRVLPLCRDAIDVFYSHPTADWPVYSFDFSTIRHLTMIVQNFKLLVTNDDWFEVIISGGWMVHLNSVKYDYCHQSLRFSASWQIKFRYMEYSPPVFRALEYVDWILYRWLWTQSQKEMS